METTISPLDDMYATTPTPAAFGRAYAERVASLLLQLDFDEIARVTEELWRARQAGGRIFLLGNGGSAATASHYANDLTIGTRSTARPFRAVSLTDNVALITAIANDFGYEWVFVKQLESLLQPDDIVFAISASGNSKNVIRAVEFANARGNCTIAVVGFNGGRLRELATKSVHIRTATGEYGPVEDLHLVLNHLMTGFLARRCAQAPAGVL